MNFAGLDLSEAASFHEDAFPALNPVDILRCVITEELSKISSVDRKLIYPALSWTNTLDKGDLLLAVPQLGIKGAPLAERVVELAKAVRKQLTGASLETILTSRRSSHKTPCSSLRKLSAFLCNSNLIHKCCRQSCFPSSST